MRYQILFAILLLASCRIERDMQPPREPTMQAVPPAPHTDSISGRYTWSAGGSEAELTLEHVRGTNYHVSGEAYWGLDRPGGPHIGELNVTAALVGSVIVYHSSDSTYRMRIECLPGVLHVTEDGILPDAGLNVTFAGTYKLVQ